MKQLLILFFVLFSISNKAESAKILHVEPINWWVGMKSPNLQLLVYGSDLSNLVPETDYPGVSIIGVERTGNKNYLFVNLVISPIAKAGIMEIKLKNKGEIEETIKYELKEREQGSSERQGFNSSDVIYQIFPDRFSNGDKNNDDIPGYVDAADRAGDEKRHGGDIQGIINHLDYISSMGYTALWHTPVMESNMPRGSYHGYAITDYYKVDPRFGSNELYKTLADLCRKKGIKLIIDLVLNHCGTEWWIYKDLPSNDWLNNYPEIKICNFRGTTIIDPYRADIELNAMTDGWFAQSMPDLNQRNPLLATYLIQNTIWWIEYAGLQGIRSDTHQFPDKDFVSKWAKQILDEYPYFNIVGEVWLSNTALIAYWQKDAPNLDHYNSNLPTIMDFPLLYTVSDAFLNSKQPNNAMENLYNLFCMDFLIANPMNVMIFADNHDLARFYTTINENITNYKLIMALLLTTRGIPQMYAGTEFLMTGDKEKGDGALRKDFPGGWPGDKVNAFTQVELSSEQIDAQNYMKRIQNWRKTNKAVTTGKMKQFTPSNGVYVYFRMKDKSLAMVVINNNKENQSIEIKRFTECLNSHSTGTEIISGKKITLTDKLEIQGKTAMIIDFE